MIADRLAVLRWGEEQSSSRDHSKKGPARASYKDQQISRFALALQKTRVACALCHFLNERDQHIGIDRLLNNFEVCDLLRFDMAFAEQRGER
jgi:hypothetical protein